MKIKELREQNDLSQTDLAKYLGVVRSTICQYEKGNRQPDIEQLIKLADYFNVTVDYLLEHNTSKTNTPNLSEKEKALLEAFNKLPHETQDFILETTQSLQNKKTVT